MSDKEVVETEVSKRLPLVKTVGTDVNVHGGRIRAGRVVPGVCKAMDVVRGLSHKKGAFGGRDL
jgi:hypothetical protein